MTKRLFRIYIDEDRKELIHWIESFKEISEGTVEILDKLRTGVLVDRTEQQLNRDLDRQIKQARLENLGYKNRIDAVRATAAETFNGKISPQADKAIEKRFESEKPQTAKQLSINAVLRFMESCKLNDENQWVVICEKCRADFIDTNREKALSQFRDHMTTQHAKELLT